ncbi:hypothetical protein EK5BL_02205 [Bifidobacterium longum subsp. longum EK5]|nr:hypothetical protein EK5BL_02205 [Bifidobacterium longum subsp. longum EK5]
MRPLEQGDDVRHHAAVARSSFRDGYALIQSEQLTARIAHCGQFALIGFVRNDDADILQHPRKPFRQIIQHLFNGPFKLIVTDVHSLSTREMPWHQVCTKALKSQTSRLSCCG